MVSSFEAKELLVSSERYTDAEIPGARFIVCYYVELDVTSFHRRI